MIRVGPRFEERRLAGISHFLEHMTFRGTPTLRTPEAQAAAFEDLGGSLDAATGVDHGTLAVSTLPEHLEIALEHLGDVATRPSLRGVDIERGTVREELLEDYDEDGELVDPDGLARRGLYGDHALGWPIAGDLETLERFDRASLRAHHRRHYTLANAVLSIAGAIPSVKRAIAAADRAFGELPRGERLVAPPAPPKRGPVIAAVDTSASQTSVRFAFRAPGRGTALEPATEILLSVLDGGLSSRLYKELCLDRGLVYDVSSTYEAFEEDGIFDVAAETEHGRVGEVVLAIASLLARLRDRGPTEAELTRARHRHAYARRAGRDAPLSTAERAASERLLGGRTYSPAARARELEAVDRAAVRAAAENVLTRAGLSLVTVGKGGRGAERRLERALAPF
jgi:predicted Zn-dependent peptidase